MYIQAHERPAATRGWGDLNRQLGNGARTRDLNFGKLERRANRLQVSPVLSSNVRATGRVWIRLDPADPHSDHQNDRIRLIESTSRVA